MALKHPEHLAYPPVTHVHVPAGSAFPVHLQALTIEEAREVIIALCDQLMVLRDDLAEKRLGKHR